MENLNNNNYKNELLEPFISEYGENFIQEFIPFLFSVQNTYLSYGLGTENDALKLDCIIQFFLNLYKEEMNNIKSIKSQAKNKDNDIKCLMNCLKSKENRLESLQENIAYLNSVINPQI